MRTESRRKPQWFQSSRVGAHFRARVLTSANHREGDELSRFSSRNLDDFGDFVSRGHFRAISTSFIPAAFFTPPIEFSFSTVLYQHRDYCLNQEPAKCEMTRARELSKFLFGVFASIKNLFLFSSSEKDD